MTPMRLGFVALSLAAIVACGFIGAPERASDTQNLNAISDDIALEIGNRFETIHP